MNKQKKGSLGTASIIVALIFVMLLAIVALSKTVSNVIVDSNIDSMVELAHHDESAIVNSLNLRWKAIESIYQTLKKDRHQTIQELISAMNREKIYVTDSEYLALVDEDGTIYKSIGTILEDEVLWNICREQSGRFVVRYSSSLSQIIELQGESLLMGIPVDLTVEDVSFCYLICNMDINVLEKELKIDSYGGEGYSSVIDVDGNYIINLNRSHSFLEIDNFFEDLEEAEFDDYADTDEVQAVIKSLEERRVITYRVKGIDYISVIMPMPDTDWYFITSVPDSVFREQSNRILGLFMIVAAVMALAIISALALIRNNQVQKLRMEEALASNRGLEVIRSLAEDYDYVCYIDTIAHTVTQFGISKKFQQMIDALGYQLTNTDDLDALFEKIVLKEDYAEFKRKFDESNVASILKEKQGYTSDFRILLEGQVIWYRLKMALDVKNVQGVVVGLYSVDAQKQAEEELAQALDLAQQANRAKTTFLNNMSHDIRTPMNAIIGFTGLAASRTDKPEMVKDYLAKISQSSEHLLSLINDILDMSRIESGKMNLTERQENLSEIFHSLKNIIQADINAKQQEIFIDTVEVHDEDIICDRLRLNQVLLNIVSNAIKYTQPGGTIVIRIVQKGVSQSGYGEYEFYVKDNGIGMSKEFLETLFDPFTRANSSTASGIQGTGLGMAITKNIVDMMGGTIEVHSEVGKGTEFVVTFHFRLASEHKESEHIADYVGLRGLVVDDDGNACKSIAKMLRDVGMRSEWCMYGKEAVMRTEEALQMGDSFRVYIIDWLMPDMNGIETTRRIRKIVGEEAPIIILTAYDWSEIEEEAEEAGVTGFVSKPVFASDIRNILKKFCGGKQEKEAEKHYDFSGKRILLAEDNELNAEIATEILTEAGFMVEHVENGKLAVERIAAAQPEEFQLVLMDVQMPEMDGYEATRRIRAMENKALAEIPIIAMTANAFEEDRQAALDAGMNMHIAKPLDIDILFQVLTEILVL